VIARAAASALVVLAPALVACQGETGTITLGLTTAPGSTVLDRVERLQVRLTHPPTVLEATRANGGFQLALEVEATDESGAIVVNGFDGANELVATGMSPAFPIAAIDARVVIYMAAPMSVDTAPVALSPPRTQLGAVPLTYGALLAGGRELASGEPSAALSIYNAFDHTLVEGMPLPSARAGLAAGVGAGGRVYLFGGDDASDAPTGTLWRFDTTVPPRGIYAQLDDRPALARTGQTMVAIGTERFLVTGAPPLEVTATSLTPRTEVESLGASGATVLGSDGVRAAVFAGDSGLVRFRDETFTVLDPTPRPGAHTAPLPEGEILVWDASGALRVDVATGALVEVPGLVPASCATPTLATTSRHLVIACEAETHVRDVATLEPLASIQRGGAVLAALPNDQVLLASGDTLALFTPAPPQ
jgi:hypothetical protein